MVKKKGRKSKAKTEEEGYTLITDEEWLAREQRTLQRLHDVQISLNFISEATDDYNELLKEQALQDNWVRFLRCDGLPLPKSPAEIHRFIAEARHNEAKDEVSLIDWTLSVDESSVLSQDIFRTDLTRETLVKTICPIIGAFYDRCIQRILDAIELIEHTLENEVEMDGVSTKQSYEIVVMRGELLREIELFLDKLTYRIICRNSTYMTISENGKMANYCYKCSNYKIHIWCLRDVPIRFNHMELPLIMAELDCVGVSVQIPLSVLVDNLTLRCVHTVFDHYTENAKSFEQVIDRPTGDFNAGMIDIEDCLINEWLMQVEIMLEISHKMAQKLEEFQEAQLLAAAQEKNGKQDDPKKVKAIKLPKHPQDIPDNMMPDPYHKFLALEQKQYLEFLEEFYNPNKFELRDNEINLRRYIMLGGIFSMFFVHKPKHTCFQKFNITMHDDGRILYIMHDIVADMGVEEEEPVVVSRVGSMLMKSLRSKISLAQSSHHSDIAMNMASSMPSEWRMKLHLADEDVPYFYVTFNLPKHLCLWGEPLACQFFEEEVEDLPEEEHIEEPEIVVAKKKKKKKSRNKSTSGKSSGKSSGKTSGKSSEPASSTAESSRTASPIRDRKAIVKLPEKKRRGEKPPPPVPLRMRYRSLVERKGGEPLNMYRSTMLTTMRNKMLERTEQPPVPLKNFEMTNVLLTNANLRNIQRHCVPRFLSSFKFPMEFREEALDEYLVKRHQRVNVLKRRQEEDESEPDLDYFFSYEDQTGPERVFPIFDDQEGALYEKLRDVDDETSDEDEEEVNRIEVVDQLELAMDNVTNTSLYGVLHNLDNIKHKYENAHNNITHQTDFVLKGQPKTKVTTRESLSPPTREGKGKSMKQTPRKSKMAQAGSTHDIMSKRLVDIQGSEYHKSNFEMEFTDVDDINEGSSKKKKTIVVDREIPLLSITPEEVKPPKARVTHWTTRYIQDTEFDKEKLTLTIKTDRLGVFGFAYKRYAHFPFRHWSVEPNLENPNEVIITLDTFYVRVILFVTSDGVRGYVTDQSRDYIVKPVKYLSIDEPISDFNDLKKQFRDMNLNIFAENDATFYIENGYFSQKHLATELHVYDAIAVHCKLMKFFRSDWNRLATRRNIAICMRNPKDISEGAEITARVTPENSTFVEIRELCSDNLDVFKLEYKPTWRNIGNYSDVHQLINSMYPYATDVRNREPKLIYYIRKLLTEIRPLSYS